MTPESGAKTLRGTLSQSPAIIANVALALAFGSQLAMAQGTPADRDARDLFAELIPFRTSAGHGQVPAMAASIVKRLTDAGVPASDIAQLPLGETTALIVRLPGSDSDVRPILFSAHMDVVDARPEDWQRDPYQMVEDGSFYFGRGATDNKAGVAALVTTITRFHRDRLVPRRTLVWRSLATRKQA